VSQSTTNRALSSARRRLMGAAAGAGAFSLLPGGGVQDQRGHKPFLDKFIQPVWYENSDEFRACAEKYYVDVLPLPKTVGLAKG